MSAKSPKLPNVLTVASAVEANCTKAAANRPRARSAYACGTKSAYAIARLGGYLEHRRHTSIGIGAG
jgi:hypothetical protein